MAAAAPDAEARGWQVGKPLTTCLKHMLENEISCDVSFNIQKSEGGFSRVSAHKLILQARSPVFDAMFSGAFLETEKDIVITDVELDAFKEMLSYMYTDEVALTGDNVMHLLYASKKYILEDLSNRCKQYLNSQITVNNVCSILTHSLVYQDEDLVKTCMDLIEPNAIAVSKTEAFYNMSHDALLKVVRNDKLVFGAEADLFQGCLEWAKRRATDKENPSGEEMRKLLGECLYKIRFPFITANVFAEQFSETTVLTGDEKTLIFALDLTKKEIHSTALASLGFDVTSRMQRGQRFSYGNIRSTQYQLVVSGDTVEDFSFASTKTFILMGFSVYGGPNGSKHEVNIRVEDTTNAASVCEKETRIDSTGTGCPINVCIKKMHIKPNVQYRAKISVKGPNSVGFGVNAQTSAVIGNCSLNFTRHSVPHHFSGQIYDPNYGYTQGSEMRGYVAEILLQTFNC